MPRMSIAEFRARLAGRAETGPVLEAYRALARRLDPNRAGAMRLEWTVWPPATQA